MDNVYIFATRVSIEIDVNVTSEKQHNKNTIMKHTTFCWLKLGFKIRFMCQLIFVTSVNIDHILTVQINQ